MTRTSLCAGVLAIVGACGGNFVTVAVTAMPCHTVAIEVTVAIEGEEPTPIRIDDPAAFADAETSFVIDFGDRSSGHATVDIVAFDAGQNIVGRDTQMIALSSDRLDVDLGAFVFDPLNFDPCEPGFPVKTGPLVTTGPDNLLDTANTQYNGVEIGTEIEIEGSEVWLIHVASMRVEDGQTLRITGDHPVLVVSDGDVVIAGTIDFSRATERAVKCMGTEPGSDSASGSGGGGGGLAMKGGDGGARDDGGGRSLGATPTTVSPVLQMGCPGINGAGSPEPAGGAAGGGLQITSRSRIVIEGGAIHANGDGGTGGYGTGTFAAGGAGGGSGGMIVLEAPTIILGSSAELCAVGGGGGQGGRTGMLDCPRGEPGNCSGASGAAFCGLTNPTAAAGGDAGGLQPPRAGANSTSAGIGGGGGGGDAGRIVLRHHGNLDRDDGETTVNPEPMLLPEQ